MAWRRKYVSLLFSAGRLAHFGRNLFVFNGMGRERGKLVLFQAALVCFFASFGSFMVVLWAIRAAERSVAALSFEMISMARE